MSNKKWFKLKYKLPWWHWVIHPIRTWRLRKYLKFIEGEMCKKIDSDIIAKTMINYAMYGHPSYYVDSKGVYGRSPADLPNINDLIEKYEEKRNNG